MELSIIVPVYNVERFLVRCVASLYDQNLRETDFEVVLIDDGSTDSSLAIAQNLQQHHANLTVYSQPNQGMSSARNNGLAHARGKYVIFVDSDDWLLPHTIDHVLEKAEERKVDICGYRFWEMGSDGTATVRMVQPFAPDCVVGGEEALLGGVVIASACANMYKKEFLDAHAIRFTVGMTHEDVDFNARAYAYAKRILFTDIVSYVYFYNTNSMNRSKDETKERKAIFDNVLVARNMKKLSQTSLSTVQKDYFSKHANSIIVSETFSLLRHPSHKSWLKEFLWCARKEGLYPIRGKTHSWKTTLFIPLLNAVWLWTSVTSKT